MAFILGSDVFVTLPTGYCKSLLDLWGSRFTMDLVKSMADADVSSFCSDIPKDIKKEESFVDNIMTVQNSIKSYNTLSDHILQNCTLMLQQ